MCVGYVTAWPAGALENPGGRALGMPAHRCQSQFDIAKICNGYADALKPIP
jgi:hypothetical protein